MIQSGFSTTQKTFIIQNNWQISIVVTIVFIYNILNSTWKSNIIQLYSWIIYTIIIYNQLFVVYCI